MTQALCLEVNFVKLSMICVTFVQGSGKPAFSPTTLAL